MSDQMDSFDVARLKNFAEAELQKECADLTSELETLLPRHFSIAEQIEWIRKARSLGLTKKPEPAEGEEGEPDPWGSVYTSTPEVTK